MADNKEENEAEAEAEENAELDFSELSDSQKEKLATHPQVRKMLEYEDTSIPQIVGMLNNLMNGEHEETYDLLVSGIEERSGRITESTIRKVLEKFVEEYQEVSN